MVCELLSWTVFMKANIYWASRNKIVLGTMQISWWAIWIWYKFCKFDCSSKFCHYKLMFSLWHRQPVTCLPFFSSSLQTQSLYYLESSLCLVKGWHFPASLAVTLTLNSNQWVWVEVLCGTSRKAAYREWEKHPLSYLFPATWYMDMLSGAQKQFWMR